MSIEKHPYKILFIEDEKEIRENYTKYLKRHFANVYEAVDGEDGLVKYKNIKPDIMIVDINLPKLTGLELLKKIRENDQSTKVIMLTAHSDTKFLLEATELKLIKYLVKPISRDELKEALDIAIDEFTKFDILPKKTINFMEGFIWDCVSQELFGNGNIVPLTNKEKSIVSLLLSNPNRVYSYDEIIMEVWDDYEGDKIDALKTIVKNIRKKLPKNTIKNVFGVGYKF